MKLLLYLDTSAMPRHLSARSQSLSTLSGLASENRAELLVSEVTLREWASQFAEEAQNALREAVGALKALGRISLGSGISHTAKYDHLLGAFGRLDAKATDSMAMNAVREYLARLNVTVVPADVNHGLGLWDAYFDGNPPFRSTKAREDIP